MELRAALAHLQLRNAEVWIPRDLREDLSADARQSQESPSNKKKALKHTSCVCYRRISTLPGYDMLESLREGADETLFSKNVHSLVEKCIVH